MLAGSRTKIVRLIAVVSAVVCGCQHVAPQTATSDSSPAVLTTADEPHPLTASCVTPARPVTTTGVEPAQHLAPPETAEAIQLPPGQRPADPDATKSVAARSVDEYVQMATADHPRVQAARARLAAARHRVPQAGALDDPMLSNNFFPISSQALQTAAGRAGNALSVSQRYPWPAKRRAQAAIASREVQVAAARLEQVELEVEEMVRLAYYELWFASRAVAIVEENRQIAAELVTLAEARNEAGGSQQDVLRAQLIVDTLDQRLIEWRRQKEVAQADLAALVQQPAMLGIEPVESLDVAEVSGQLDSLFAAAERCSPRLEEQQWAIARDRNKQNLARLESYPDFVLGAGWQTITESAAVSPVANGRDNVHFSVGMTLPLWRDRLAAARREASAEVAATAQEYRHTSDDTQRQIRRLLAQAEAAEQELRLYRERFLPRAQRALRLSSADYRGQLVDFGEVADGFSEVLTVELQVARATASLAGIVAQLHRVVGCEVLETAESTATDPAG